MVKKILIYSDCFTYSGSENVIENILRSSIINSNYTIEFYYAFNEQYHARLKNKLDPSFSIQSVSIFGHTRIKNRFLLSSKNSISRIVLKVSLYFSYFFRLIGLHSFLNFFILRSILKRIRPEIFIINNGGYPGALSCRIAALATFNLNIKKKIFIVNNLASKPINIFDKGLDFAVIKNIDYFVTASSAAKHQLSSKRLIPSSKCFNIPNTIWKESMYLNTLEGSLRALYGIPETTLIIGSVGLFTYRKGFSNLIEAISLLCLSGNSDNFVCVIIGEGELLDDLNRLIVELNLTDRVYLTGYKENIEMFIKDFDVFVIPSIENEDFPYVVLEAMLLGKVVIGTKVAGIVEQIEDGVTGFLVNPNMPIEITEKLSYLKSNRNLCSTMGINAKQKYFDNFSYDKIMGTYCKLLNE